MKYKRVQGYLPEYDSRIKVTEQTNDERSIRYASISYTKYRMAQLQMLFISNIVLLTIIVLCAKQEIPPKNAIILVAISWLFLTAIAHILSCVLGRVWRRYAKYLETGNDPKSFWSRINTDALERWAERKYIDRKLQKARQLA